MRAAIVPPPRRPASSGSAPIVRAVASALLALLCTGSLAFGLTWVLWSVVRGLLGLVGLFAHTGAHAGLAAALAVLLAALAPLVVTALLAALTARRTPDV